MMTVDEAMNHAQNELERAFEKWLTDECPSGDCESVQRQWDDSFAHQELVDELQPVMALTLEVRRLREENERQHFDILAMNQSLDLLREENERLRKDAEKHKSIPVRFVSHQHIKLKVTDANPNPVAIRIISECDGAWFDMPQEKIDVMRIELQSAIDAARGAK